MMLNNLSTENTTLKERHEEFDKLYKDLANSYQAVADAKEEAALKNSECANLQLELEQLLTSHEQKLEELQASNAQLAIEKSELQSRVNIFGA